VTRDDRSGQQELPVSEPDNIDPTFSAGQPGGTCGVETEMLFDKPEKVFDGEAPQIHAADIGQGDGEWA
jgi:hypothetical protein